MLLVAAAPAAATTVTYTPQRALAVNGGPAANSVVLSRTRNSYLVDDGSGVTAGRLCRQVSATRAACPVADLVDVTLGAGDDSADNRGLAGTRLDGGSGADHLVGGPYADTLLGGDGLDRIEGGGGNDTLTGDASLAEPDTLDGGPGSDTVDFSGREAPVTFDLYDD